MKKCIVKVVRSCPTDGQDGITHLIGKVFNAEVDDKGRATVHSNDFNGQIILGPEEWIELEPTANVSPVFGTMGDSAEGKR